MSHTNICSFEGRRGEMLVAYLYGDGDARDRALLPEYEAHIASCAACRAELAALGGVRSDLRRWMPPEPSRPLQSGGPQAEAAGRRPPGRWGDLPVWARVSAAALVIGIAAGLANISITYDAAGLSVSTGWRASGSSQAVPPAGVVQTAAGEAPVTADAWRADLAALERQIRAELDAAAPGRAAQPADERREADLMRRMRAMIEESERNQQRELALRVAEISSETRAQRQADLTRINRSLGAFEQNTGIEVMRQRELLNRLVRTSQLQ